MKKRIKKQVGCLLLTLSMCASAMLMTVSAAEVNSELTDNSQDIMMTRCSYPIAFKSDYAPGKTYDGTALNNPQASDLKLEDREYKDVVFTWYAGSAFRGTFLGRVPPADVGIYSVVASIIEDDKEVCSAVKEEIVISPLVISSENVVVTLDDSPVCDGSEKTQTIKSVVVGGLTLAEGKDYSVTGNTGTNAGSYYLTISGQGNFTGTYTVPWKIMESREELTKAPEARALTYNGNPQELVIAGAANHGTVMYSLDVDGEYTETIPTATEAGKYTVWYYVQGENPIANYSDTAKVSVETEIRKAIPSYSVPDNLTAVYGQTLGDVALDNGFTWQEDSNVSVGNAGQNTFKANYTPADTMNYDIVSDIGVMVQVDAKPVTVPVIEVSSDGLVYNGKPQTPASIVVKDGDAVIPDAEYTVSYSDHTNAGTASVVITDKSGGNYEVNGSAAFTIEKASIQITVEDESLTAGSPMPVFRYKVSGLAEGDTLRKEPGLTSSASGTGQVGIYTITASGAEVPDTGNYNTAIAYVDGKMTVTAAASDGQGSDQNHDTEDSDAADDADKNGDDDTDDTYKDDDDHDTDKSDDGSTESGSSGSSSTGHVTGSSGVSSSQNSATDANANQNKITADITESEKQSPSDDTEEEDPAKLPLSDEENALEEEATGSDVSISQMIEEKLEQVLDGSISDSVIRLDLTALDRKTDTVEFSLESIKSIVDTAESSQNTELSLSIRVYSGTVEIDYATMCAILEQADGSYIRLVLEDCGTENLNESQKESIKDHEIHGGVEAYLICVGNGNHISDFYGGEATLSIPFSVPDGYEADGFSVWYVDDEGGMTRQDAVYKDSHLVWNVGHFSDFVIIYEEPEEEIPVVPEEEPQQQTESALGVFLDIVVWIVLFVCLAFVFFLFRKNRED